MLVIWPCSAISVSKPWLNNGILIFSDQTPSWKQDKLAKLLHSGSNHQSWRNVHQLNFRLWEIWLKEENAVYTHLEEQLFTQSTRPILIRMPISLIFWQSRKVDLLETMILKSMVSRDQLVTSCWHTQAEGIFWPVWATGFNWWKLIQVKRNYLR